MFIFCYCFFCVFASPSRSTTIEHSIPSHFDIMVVGSFYNVYIPHLKNDTKYAHTHTHTQRSHGQQKGVVWLYYIVLLLQCQWNCQTYITSCFKPQTFTLLRNSTHTHTHAQRTLSIDIKNLLWYSRKLTKLMISLYTANGFIIQIQGGIYRHPRTVQLKSSLYDSIGFRIAFAFRNIRLSIHVTSQRKQIAKHTITQPETHTRSEWKRYG